MGKDDLLVEMLAEFEQIIIETTLYFTHGKKKEATELLGCGRNRLTRKLKDKR